jgi:hypothetical protein
MQVIIYIVDWKTLPLVVISKAKEVVGRWMEEVEVMYWRTVVLKRLFILRA